MQHTDMSNLIGIPSADYYETRLANMWNWTNGTVYVEKVPEGSMPISEYSYIVVNPWEVNMQVAKIDGWDSDNDTFNVIDVAIPSGAWTYYNAKNHPVGSVVRFSNNYAFWKDIQEAINGKLDITSLAPVAVSNDYNDLCNKPTIPTDNCQLCNGCWYITWITCEEVEDALWYTPYDSTNPDGYTTCIWNVTNDDLQCYVKCSDIPDLSEVAKCCDIPTDNCQLSNGCSYTTCTWTLQACDIADLAHCCDIPTNNCELINWCWYITWISCSDVTTALWYSPADSSNLWTASTCNVWTSCGNVPVLWADGKLSENVIPSVAITDTYEVANKSDLLSLSAQRWDIWIVSSENKSYVLWWTWVPSVESNWKLLKTPTDAVLSVNWQTWAVCINVPTDNSELANGCGYTTCKWTVVAGDLTPYAKCCELWTVAFSNKYCDLSGQPTIPTDNCQLWNSCWYTTCTWTLTSADIAWLAQCCDLAWKQDTLTAWNWIDITSNKISTTFVYWESTTAAATVQKEVSIPSITELNVWQVIIVKPTVTSTVASSTLKLNSFPAYKMLYNGAEITTSTDSVVWSANVPSMFYLDEVSGTKYWRFLWHWLDSNSTYTLNRLIDPSRYKVWTGTYAFSRYSLVMEKADWTWEKLTDTTQKYSTGTTKTVNTNWFRLWHIRYYNTTSNLANWALVGSNAIDIQAPSVTAAYSFNCGTAPWWAVWTPIYLVGSMWADWLFYLDTTQRWSTQLPSTNDWKLYIRLWTALSADNSTFSLIAEKPIFYYDNWIKEYKVADNKQDKSAMVTTLTWADDSHYPTAKAVSDAIQWAWAWDMMKSVYDPSNCCADAFNYCNFYNTPTIPDISNLAQCCDIPTNNNQLANWCGYTTCTWTVSTCADIISKLWYTPYNSTNPNWYTTCTWTLIPSNIACINGCCLTNGGNVCIESGWGGTVMCETSYDPWDYKQDFLYFTY